ncbi:uncharacterized protein A1O9_06695, partial [Exophiala aquamarina CBS 119918]
MALAPSTWRLLGLSVATGYIGLGTFTLSAPVLAGKALGVYPSASESAGSALISKKHHQQACASMGLLAARDLSIGLALFAFDYQNAPHAMGTLILSGMVLCAADVYHVFMLRGWEWASLLGVGAASWCAIGIGLIG